METFEDDDDTHFCIKCNLTIHGLDNYVRHRQSGCRPPDDKNDTVHESPSTPTTVSYPEILNADAFFNSLELQSSKSNPRRAPDLLDNGRKYKKEERKKKGQKSVQVDADEPGAKDKLHSMLPAVSELDDSVHLCIQSLVFPDIVASTILTGKTSASVTPSKLTQSMSQAGSNMDGASFPAKHESETSLESLMTDSKQTDRKRQENPQRMESDHQTWLEDIILADLTLGNSENKELTRYDFEYQQDDDSEDDMLDDDSEEDDSYSDSDDGENRERPPRGHTGGKWKPELGDLPQDMPHMHEDDVDPEDDHQERPPPTYTGGKWKPTETTQKIEEYESKDTSGQPPPGYTRGKWVPGARTDIESGYWCNPCGRKLASRLVYNRHLLSDLHARRSIREIDDGVHLPRGMDSYANRRVSTRRKASFAMKAQEEPERKEGKKGVRRREKEFLSCEMCRSRVRRPQMGKHLLSHYHCRVAGVNPCSPSARRFLLENMANVVRQCSFQCAPCRFYCNTEETFLLHWRSDLHVKTLEQIGGNCKCTPCDFWCEDSEMMEAHLLSANHREVVSMMNGSVPVVISCQRALPCRTCDRQFRYNFQLRVHAKETGHEPNFTASDEYQHRIRCDMCPKIVRSLISLQRHQLHCHVAKDEGHSKDTTVVARPAPYFCSFCSMNFVTTHEAIRHRRTSSHKEAVKARKSQEGLAETTVRECSHCNEKCSNLPVYKNHLLHCHPELCHRCPRCGVLFALSQEVTRHTREGNCTKDDEMSMAQMMDVEKEWKCKNCAFSTDSRGEYVFHEALHAGAVETDEGTSSTDKLLPKYQCPICQKTLTKASLRIHIRQHTGEKPFPCAKCSASFSKRSDLNAHRKVCSTSLSAECLDKTGRQRNFVCSDCKGSFYTKHALQQHMLRHSGKKYKCGLPGCPTVLRTASELERHRKLTHDGTEKQYSCPDCSYAAKTKTQLRRHRAKHEDAVNAKERQIHCCSYAGCDFKTKVNSHLQRHVRLHTGSKPYKCRHCSYACNNLENLRKHVLSTNLHPGKTIYECNFCDGETADPFRTNFAKELRAHLSEAHVGRFPTPDHANKYVLEIFSATPSASTSN
ncbi:PREDICTED: zinc finger protein 845 [Dinoponera quadriceps]|uniref:Zinc finger protein 845 n=1 Tax=Dinoponera quadriceps TaxID=609295 RepID=A0A6P3XR64_DINQU|nr:PREDICTED: zinc finger protein 845 [Dinoponera quadriceps]XP_014480413.1 PREDICTED: zinc finger protein 845 [Dinoponera quadriceps]